jgi:putative DNA primase/helicase
MAACVTCPGREWPCGEGKAPQGNVILFTAEDDLADTVIPRLVAAGAARDRVAIVKMVRDIDKHGQPRSRMFNLARDLEMLRAKMTEIGDVVLLIIDPVSAYLGRSNEVDSFRDTDVRSVLAPLQDLASEMRTAVIGLMHFNKKVDVLNMLLRICNSIAFAAASRHAYGVVHDPGTNRQLLVRGKNNLARRDDRALAFRIDAYEVGRDKRNGKPIEAPFLIWEAEYVDITATEALQAVNESKAPGARGQAKAWLREQLRDGPASQTEIEETAKAEGIAIKTLRRAKAELGVVAKHDGPLNSEGNKTWRWHPPANHREGEA